MLVGWKEFQYVSATDSFPLSPTIDPKFLTTYLPAINRNGTLIVGSVENGYAAITDASFHAIINIRGVSGGAAFDPRRISLWN